MAEEKNVAAIARQALLDMAKNGVPPSPENYKAHFDKISGIVESDPVTDALESLHVSAFENGLSDWLSAIELAMSQKDWKNIEKMILSSMRRAKSKSVDMATLSGILYVMERFAKNVEHLGSQIPGLAEQVSIVTDLLESPSDRSRLLSAKRALSCFNPPVDMKGELDSAKDIVKRLTAGFVAQMAETGAETEVFANVLRESGLRLESASDKETLLRIGSELISATASVGTNIKKKRDEMEQTLSSVDAANAKIAALEQELKLSAEQSKRDYLTGVMNRRGLEETLSGVLSEGWDKVTLALLDVDNFKKLNDSMGHEAGDVALKHLAGIVERGLSGRGVLARLGGEEFVVVFQGFDALQVKAEMEKVQRLLTKEFFMAGNEKRVITFSCGVAQRLPEESFDETMARADDAMYVAKGRGKNRVEISQD